MSIAMVFPGQGSQSTGMQAELASRYDIVAATYAEASEVLGYDLWQVVQEGPEDHLATTTVTQPAMLAAGVAAWRIWQHVGGAGAVAMAGHSLGEYTALACAGVFSFRDAMIVVKRRSQLMQDAVPFGTGGMAAVLGLNDDAVRAACAAVTDGVVEAVNFNSPGQVVIAGHKNAVEKALENAQQAGARRAVMLPVSVPAHSSLMRAAGEALAETLDAVDVGRPDVPVFSASDAQPYGDAGDIRRKLARQVHSPVQWSATVHAMVEAGATTVVECGPGKVLAGLVRRIDRAIRVANLDTLDSLDKLLGEAT